MILECGRSFICSQLWCDFVSPVINKYPTNAELCKCCLSIILNMNVHNESRKVLLQQNYLPLLLTISNYCQKDSEVIALTLQVIRSICSAERILDSSRFTYPIEESYDLVIRHNTISYIIMNLMSHPMDVAICTQGTRALEWIIKTGGMQIVKSLIDEGTFDVCIDILQNHDDIDLVNGVSRLLIKIIRSSSAFFFYYLMNRVRRLLRFLSL